MTTKTQSGPVDAGAREALGQLHRGVQSVMMQLMRVRQRIAGLEARERLRETGKEPALPVVFRSQYGEDVYLWDLLGGQTEGFFIEAGAFDGLGYSVTYALEAVGWKGLLVEAIPERAAQCKENRPGSRVVHTALSKRGAPAEAEFTVTQDQYGGMLSFLKTTAEQQRELDAAGFARTKVKVPVTTLNALLEGHAGTIDVAVLDVEGGEMDLLDGFDVMKHRPRVIVIEDNHPQAAFGVSAAMGTLPYVQVAWVGVNRVYVRSDETGLQERARALAM